MISLKKLMFSYSNSSFCVTYHNLESEPPQQLFLVVRESRIWAKVAQGVLGMLIQPGECSASRTLTRWIASVPVH